MSAHRHSRTARAKSAFLTRISSVAQLAPHISLASPVLSFMCKTTLPTRYIYRQQFEIRHETWVHIGKPIHSELRSNIDSISGVRRINH